MENWADGVNLEVKNKKTITEYSIELHHLNIYPIL